MNNRFTRVIDHETAKQKFGNHQRPISDDTVRLPLITNNIRCRCPARRPILIVRIHQECLQWTMQCQNWHHVKSSRGISSQMKVDIAFPTQMAEQGSRESVVNAILLHELWRETRGANQTSWCGVKSV